MKSPWLVDDRQTVGSSLVLVNASETVSLGVSYKELVQEVGTSRADYTRNMKDNEGIGHRFNKL